MAEVRAQVTEYMVTALPEGHRDASIWALWVQWRGGRDDNDRYCIAKSPNGATQVWDEAAGEWVWESIPSERRDEFIVRTRYSALRALEIARRLAPEVCWNGLRPADILARDAARRVGGGS